MSTRENASRLVPREVPKTACAILGTFEGDIFLGGRALVRKGPADEPSPTSSVIGWLRRLAAASPPAVTAQVAELGRRLDAAEAGLQQADDKTIALFSHGRDVTDAIAVRVADAEDRLAELEVDRSRLAEAVRRDGATDDLAYWRERLAGPTAPPPSVTRHGGVVRVATDVGALLLPAHDEVMLSFMRQHGEWEKEESDELRTLLRPGMTFVDVGAHVGYMSVLAAQAVGPTGRGIAFEPEPGNFRLLLANLANHGIDNVEAIPAVAWAESGRQSLSLCEDNTGDHRAYALPGREAVEVLAFALDDILPENVKVDVVKVDAQATDDIAISGMERTLARSRPTLVVEFWPDGIAQRGGAPMDVLRYYQGLGYDVAVLGQPATPMEAVLQAALASPTEFCTLVLTPSR